MAAKNSDEPKKPEEPADNTGSMLDMSQAAVKKMIATARSRGYITYDELNEVLPPDQVTSEQIEDVMSMLSEMGINVIDNDEAEEEDGAREVVPASDDGGSRELTMTSVGGEALDRTDDPVRMYLREMGSVELLAREGEIAIAKRIEAGRNTMIAGLCESPLTFQAITIWRDELLDEAIMLREVIDLETTFSGQMEADDVVSVISGVKPDLAPPAAKRPNGPEPAAAPPRPAPAAAPAAASLRRRRGRRGRRRAAGRGGRGAGCGRARRRRGRRPGQPVAGGDGGGAEAAGAGDARPHRHRLPAAGGDAGRPHLGHAEPQRAVHLAPGARVSAAARRDRRDGQLAAPAQQPHRGAGRPALRHQPQDHDARRLDGEAGRPGPHQPPGVHRRVPRLRAGARLARPGVGAQDPRLGHADHAVPRQGRRDPRRHGLCRPAGRRRHLRVPPHRQPGAEGREGGAAGQEGDGRGQPAAGDLDRQEIHQPRPAVPGPDPGGQHRPDEGGRQVRVPPRLQVLDLRHLVDPAGDHPRASPTRRGRSAFRCT